MVHESVPTTTCYAFGSHPHRVFSIRYVLTGYFHCDSTSLGSPELGNIVPGVFTPVFGKDSTTEYEEGEVICPNCGREDVEPSWGGLLRHDLTKECLRQADGEYSDHRWRRCRPAVATFANMNPEKAEVLSPELQAALRPS